MASAFGTVAGSPSGFESGDGNMTVGTNGATDWNCFTTWPTTGPGAINVGGTCNSNIDPANYFQEATNPAQVDPQTAGNGHNDVTWKPGQKMDTACARLVPPGGTGGAPSKDTITNFGLYTETSTSGGVVGDTYVYGGTIRATANGNANENIELNQQGPTATCPINRTQGDKLIAIDYTGGGASANFKVYTWVSNPTGSSFVDAAGDTISGTCLVGTSSSVSPSGCFSSTIKNITATGYAEGAANLSPIAAADNGISDQDLLTGEFAEFGVNLAGAGVLPSGTCKGFADTVIETRSSSSFTSNPEDIEVANKPISNCGTINIIKATKPAGLDQVFGFSSNLTPQATAGGVSGAPCTEAGVASDGSFCLDAADGSTSGNEVTESQLAPGTYTISEGAEPTGFTFDNVDCVSSTGATVPTNQTSSTSVSLGLAAGETITCTYTNDQKLGALRIIKENAKNTATKLSGAQFTIAKPGGSLLTNPATGTTTFTTNAAGQICVDNLTPLGSYTVTETGAPANYGLAQPASQSASVGNVGPNGCSAGTFTGSTFTFDDPPLTDVTVTAKSEVASPNNTDSTVSCTDNGGAGGTSTTWTNATSFGDPASANHNGYRPGTYTVTCTVTIDP